MPTPAIVAVSALGRDHLAGLRAIHRRLDDATYEAAVIAAHLSANEHITLTWDTIADADADAVAAAASDLTAAGVTLDGIDELVAAHQIASERDGGPGAVFTPSWVADLMANMAIPDGTDTEQLTVIDPACGCGALLAGAVRRIHTLEGGRRPAGQIVAANISGADIDDGSVRRTRQLLTITAAHLGDTTPIAWPDTALRTVDSSDPASWDGHTGRYDAVISNPPYVRYQDLELGDRERLTAAWQTARGGNWNLYYVFAELAELLRAPGGLAVTIAPNNWLRAASAKATREWMAARQPATTIVDYGGARVFGETMTYTAICATGDGPAATLTYCNRAGRTGDITPPAAGEGETVAWTELGGAPWKLTGDAATAARVAAASSGGVRLGDICDVRYGLATLRDSVYLLDGTMRDGCYVKTVDGHDHLIEAAATRPAVKVPEARTQTELDNAPGRILFPYTHNADGTATVWTDAQLAAHPGAAGYLEAVREELARRDHGRKQYAAWFAYGRTQGLAAWTGERLLTPLYGREPRFLWDRVPGRMFTNGCAVSMRADTAVTLELVAAVLNSSTFQWWVQTTAAPISGGYHAYQKGPITSFVLRDSVVERASEILAAGVAERDAVIADCYRVEQPAAA